MTGSTITFTTDFGYADPYVGAMKGVALGVNPDASLVDVSHAVEPLDVVHGAFVLANAAPFFPAGTIHVAVVDPGVGTERKALAVAAEGQVFVLPDNGLLTFLLRDAGALSCIAMGTPFLDPFAVPVPEGWSVIALTKDAFWRNPVSPTFHGRDIFAPVAAHLSNGVDIAVLGEGTDSIKCLNIPVPQWDGDSIEGRIVRVDQFGNLVSTISNNLVKTDARVLVADAVIAGLAPTFQAGVGLIALKGSSGYVEIAISGGSAAGALGAKVGDVVKAVR
jgi:S-adenosylmethionine hydrolase